MEKSYLEQKRFFSARYETVKSTLISILNNTMLVCPKCLKAITVFNIAKCITPETHGDKCRVIGGDCFCGTTVVHMHKAEILEKIIEES